MNLETENLLLRPAALDDLDALHALWTDPDVRRYLWDDQEIPLETALEVIRASLESFAREEFGQWVVIEKAGGAVAGFCGLRRVDDGGEIELLYGLEPAFWGRGFATEASRAVIEHAFDRLRLEEISADTDAPNTASVRVIERLGMKFRGERKRGDLPAVHYTIRRDEFLRGAKPRPRAAKRAPKRA